MYSVHTVQTQTEFILRGWAAEDTERTTSLPASSTNLTNWRPFAPIAAWVVEAYDGCKIAQRKIPVWAFHGKLDTVIPYSEGVIAFSEILSCTTPAPEAELIFTTYDDRYHDSWIPVYDTGHTYHEPNLYEWLLRQRRADPGVATTVNDGELMIVRVFPKSYFRVLHSAG